MDKIICEICGTSYPDSSSQCPICGYSKPVDAKIAPEPTAVGSYQYVKGGRFSSNNVRKKQEDEVNARTVVVHTEEQPVKKGSNFVLGIIAIVLLVIFIGALIFLISKILDSDLPSKPESTTDTTAVPVHLVLDQEEIEFTAAKETWTIQASLDPSDPSAVFAFSSSDPSVATVDEYGVVTAVAPGNAVITVFCEELSREVNVVCSFEPEPTIDPNELKLNRSDITFDKKGSVWALLSGDCTIPQNLITWSSDDETVATVEGGTVTAVGAGTTKVFAVYEDVKVSCTIRCKFPDDSASDPTEGEAEVKEVSISHTDVTVSVDESFYLVLRDPEGKALSVTWTPVQADVITIEGNKITGVKAGSRTDVSTTYDDKTYKCTVRVRKE